MLGCCTAARGDALGWLLWSDGLCSLQTLPRTIPAALCPAFFLGGPETFALLHANRGIFILGAALENSPEVLGHTVLPGQGLGRCSQGAHGVLGVAPGQ